MRVVIIVAILLSWASAVYAISVGSSADPYQLAAGSGELYPQSQIMARNTNGYTQKSSILPAPSTSAVVITTWQSLAQNSATGSFSVINTGHVLNFNIYDGGMYNCKNPVLGTLWDFVNNPSTINGINCQIGDSLVTAGTYTDVVVVSMAVGGTVCSDWVGGQLSNRITATIARLAASKLTTASGFTGGVWVVPHGGESDQSAGTPRATLAQCIRDFSAAWSPLGAYRFFVPTESMLSGVTSATVTGAQADAVASGCTNCRQGANVDSITTASRQGDGTHMTGTGAASQTSLDVSVITNCKNTAC